MRVTRLLVPLLIAAAVPVLQAADLHRNPQHLQPRDVFDLEWADSPAVSPDGRQIVYQRNHFDIMKDRRRSHLWLLSADGSSHRPLTSGQAGDGPASWSPQGDRIAWVSGRDGSSQIWMRWMDTGQTAVISQLTESPGNLAWSPDGKWLAFTMRVPADTRPLAQLPRKPAGAEWAPEVRVIDSLTYRADGGGYIRPGHSHVFVLAAEGGTPRQVTRGNFQHRGAPAWSPDGKSLYVSTNYHEDWQHQQQESEIYRIDVATGQATALTSRAGPDRSPAVSPDGRQIAYLGYDDRKLGHHVTKLYLLDLASGRSTALAES
ncbi:DPP IV N-terminal domain-containing protein, partial [Pseudofulvimonas gallinarii]